MKGLAALVLFTAFTAGSWLRAADSAVGTVPASAVGTVPGSAMGNAPDSSAVTAAASAVGTVPGSAMGNAPDSSAVTAADSAVGTVPASAVKAVYLSCRKIKACDVPALMQRNGADYIPVACVNWPGYPYRPAVKVAIAACRDAVLLHYAVDEEETRAEHRHDGERVFEDSCVEFFCRFPGEETYYNFEFNCIGAALVAAGPMRQGRVPAPENVYASIDRWSSIGSHGMNKNVACNTAADRVARPGGAAAGRQGVENTTNAGGSVAVSTGAESPSNADSPGQGHEESIVNSVHWELALVIPYGSFFQSDVRKLKNGSILANFHKCGSRLSRRQLLTAFPVSTGKPDLHSPGHFREILFLYNHAAVD